MIPGVYKYFKKIKLSRANCHKIATNVKVIAIVFEENVPVAIEINCYALKAFFPANVPFFICVKNQAEITPRWPEENESVEL